MNLTSFIAVIILIYSDGLYYIYVSIIHKIVNHLLLMNLNPAI